MQVKEPFEELPLYTVGCASLSGKQSIIIFSFWGGFPLYKGDLNLALTTKQPVLAQHNQFNDKCP